MTPLVQPTLLHWRMEGEMRVHEHTALLRHRVLIGLAVLSGLLGLSGIESWAIDDERSRATLRGLQGVDVIVEDLSSEVERAGLTARQLQTDVELRLRRAGIPLFTRAERVKVPGKPFLAISVHIVPRSDGMLAAYSIRVELYQVAFLETDASMITVSTWDVTATGSIGIPFLATLRDSIRDYVDRFINAYLNTHPGLASSASQSSASPRRDLIRQVQQRLLAVGYNPGSIDGALGPQTRDALRWFQNTKGLRPTGEPDEATLDALGVR